VNIVPHCRHCDFVTVLFSWLFL